jgi:hypothetical protein
VEKVCWLGGLVVDNIVSVNGFPALKDGEVFEEEYFSDSYVAFLTAY